MSPSNRSGEATVRQNGAAIRAIRELRGMTVDQLANAVLVSRPYLSHIENETKITPTVKVVARLAEALGVSYQALVCERADVMRRSAA